MRRWLIFTALLLVALSTGCELFVIGSGSGKPEIERSQRSSMGVVHLWKAEIDTGNVAAATDLMRHSSGRQLLALERYELADDLQHWTNIIGGKPITATVADTTNDSTHNVTITVDYTRNVQFSTLRKNEKWFVSKVW